MGELKSFVYCNAPISCNQFLVRPEAKFKHANKHTYVIGYTVSIYCLHTKVRMGKVRSKSPIFCFMTLFCFDADATFAASADDRSKYAHATHCAAAAIVTGIVTGDRSWLRWVPVFKGLHQLVLGHSYYIFKTCHT